MCHQGLSLFANAHRRRLWKLQALNYHTSMLPSLGMTGRRCYTGLRVGMVLIVLANMQICMRSLVVSVTLMPTSNSTEMSSMPASNTTEVTSLSASNDTKVTSLPEISDTNLTLMPATNVMEGVNAAFNATEVTSLSASNDTKVTSMPSTSDTNLTLMPASNDTKLTSILATNDTELTSMPATSDKEVVNVTSNTTEMTTAVPTTIASYRLPSSVYPLHYNLELQTYINYTDRSNFAFRGSVKILVRCDNATDIIILHVDRLIVDNTSITLAPETPSDTGDAQYSSCKEDKARQFFTVRLDKDMEAGRNYWIQMNFTSRFANDLIGLYISKSERGNQTVYTVTSQFEPIYARKAFPCFDEPAMRATFNISLVRPADRISLSNMPIDHSEAPFLENGTTFVKDVYQQTPNMSTYLLAFVVCDFANLSVTHNNVTYRTWAEPESVNATRYVLDLAAPMTEFLEKYFDVKYPLPKQDIVGVAEFEFGAMENWGLIVVKEIYMLYTEGVTILSIWDSITGILAHELVHMWLGNIVAISWWSDVWLKEATTSYMEVMAVDAANPHWRTFDRFVIDKLQLGFYYEDSMPLYLPAETPDDIKRTTRYASYLKGPAVIRMLQFVLGEATFRNALVRFIKKYLYSSVNHNDFYSVLTEEARSNGLDLDVKEFMDTWVLQGDFPMVTVTQQCDNISSIQVTQERFLANPSNAGKYISPFNYRWNIPLTFASSNYTVFNQSGLDVYWLHKEEDSKMIEVKIDLPDCADPNGWILANVQHYGFYRVNYDKSNWEALTRQLNRDHSVIPSNNRAQIIKDAWSLYKFSYITIDTALATLDYLHNEREYSPWHAATPEINFLVGLLKLSPVDEPFRRFMREKLTPPFRQFGLVNITRDYSDKFTQIQVAKLACDFHVQECWDQALRVYRSLMEGNGRLPNEPDIKKKVLCYGIAAGSTAEWEFAVDMFNKASSSGKYEMLDAMACSQNTQILNRYLSALLHGNATFPDISTDNQTFPDTSTDNLTFPDTSTDKTTFPNTSMGIATFPDTSTDNPKFTDTYTDNATFPTASLDNATFSAASADNATIQASSMDIRFPAVSIENVTFPDTSADNATFVAASTNNTKFPAAFVDSATFPDTSTDNATFPAASTDNSFPAASMNNATFSDTSTYNATVPATSTDNATVPATSTDNATVPATSTDNATVPATSTDNATVPATSTDNATVPATSTDNATVPATSTDNATVPATSTDNATVPATSTDNPTITDTSTNNATFADTSTDNTTVPARSNEYTAFTDEGALSIIQTVMDTRKGRSVAWQFYRDNYQKLIQKYNKTLHCTTALSILAGYLNSEKEMKEVYDFRAQYCDTYNMTAFNKTVIKPIKDRIDWLEKNSPIITTWLIKNGIITN